jgi:bifunctional oligoribonuclease and PAP phosphatase NrnA
MHESFPQAKQLLEQASSILLTTHERTDGDDLGSTLALAHHLKNSGKQVAIVVSGGVPQQLKYLPMSELVTETLPAMEFDALVISGCSVRERVKHDEILQLKIPTINLDHHPDNTQYGEVNVVDHTKSSVAELTYDFFKFAEWEITHEIALCLLTGIVTDTGIFMHSNTQASTLAAAAELMTKGARVSTVTKNTYEGKDLSSLKAWSKALGNAHYDPKQQMIYSIITADELDELGNPPLSAFEGIVETLNKVPEAKFAMFLKQDKDVIKGSLRSEEHKGIDVQAIAQSLGGGGHKLAAGFTLLGTLARDSRGKWEVV